MLETSFGSNLHPAGRENVVTTEAAGSARSSLGAPLGRAAGAATAPKGRGVCERKQLRGPGRGG